MENSTYITGRTERIFYWIDDWFQSPQQEDWDSSTAFSALKHFERLVETTRMTLLGPGCRETLTAALDTVIERTQDFTDSAYTTHEHRENILLLCDRAQLELNTLLRIGNSMVRVNFFNRSLVQSLLPIVSLFDLPPPKSTRKKWCHGRGFAREKKVWYRKFI